MVSSRASCSPDFFVLWQCPSVVFRSGQTNDNTIIKKKRATEFFKKYTSHFIWKGCMWEGVGNRTELQHIDPHSIAHNRVSFPFSGTAQPGGWGPASLGAGFHYRILFLTRLFPNCSIGGLGPILLGAGFLYRILSPTGLVSKLNVFLSSLSYIIIQCPLLLVGVTIALIQPIHGQGYNSDIPRTDAPVIYTGAFPIITARPGRRSIYNPSTSLTFLFFYYS